MVANAAFFRNGYVTRKTYSLPARLGLVKLGLHNPHFATFGRASVLKSERFNVGLRGSDIEYFLKIFSKRPRVTTLNEVATLQEQLSAILDHMRTINELDTSRIPPTAQVIPLRNVMREDEPRPSLPVEAVLANAPDREGDFFRVPPVLE